MFDDALDGMRALGVYIKMEILCLIITLDQRLGVNKNRDPQLRLFTKLTNT